MAESVGKRRSARTRLPSLKAELNDSSRSTVTSTPLSSRAKRYQKEKSNQFERGEREKII